MTPQEIEALEAAYPLPRAKLVSYDERGIFEGRSYTADQMREYAAPMIAEIEALREQNAALKAKHSPVSQPAQEPVAESIEEDVYMHICEQMQPYVRGDCEVTETSLPASVSESFDYLLEFWLKHRAAPNAAQPASVKDAQGEKS